MDTIAAPTGRPGSRLRARRAGVARCLAARAPGAVGMLDWDALERAPDWLALPCTELARFQGRVGAVPCAHTLRLWIDGPRLAAASDLLGAPFLAALLVGPETGSAPIGLVDDASRIDSAAHVGPVLQAAGASVLLASMAHGPLRDAAVEALAPTAPSRTLTQPQAEAVFKRALVLGALVDLRESTP